MYYSNDELISNAEEYYDYYHEKYERYEENILLIHKLLSEYLIDFQSQHSNIDVSNFTDLLNLCEEYNNIFSETSN